MIYGPYSTGWRSETDRRNTKARRRGAWLGLALVLASAAVFGWVVFGWVL